MGKFFVPTNGPESWRSLLAQPERQWRTGFSAKTLADCWEDTGGFPESVNRVFAESGVKWFEGIEFLLGIPEHRTPLPGKGRDSQSDIFVLARSSGKLMTITVEGKVEEGFGNTVNDWFSKGSTGKRNKQTRLDGLCNWLELPISSVGDIKYQLLHRTAATLIEAERFNASTAIMLVHSFGSDNKDIEDYRSFLSLFDVYGAPNTITSAGIKNGVELYLSWVTGEKQYLLA